MPCATCQHGEPTDAGPVLCHRYPPTVLGIEQVGGDEVADVVVQVWPAMASSDWCGEYQPAPEPTPEPAPTAPPVGARLPLSRSR